MSLIECPQCKLKGKTQILGRWLENGKVMVLRFHHGTTLIEGSDYHIKCGCGYQLAVKGGGTVATEPA